MEIDGAGVGGFGGYRDSPGRILTVPLHGARPSPLTRRGARRVARVTNFVCERRAARRHSGTRVAYEEMREVLRATLDVLVERRSADPHPRPLSPSSLGWFGNGGATTTRANT